MGEVLLADPRRRRCFSPSWHYCRHLDRRPRSFPRRSSVEKGFAELLQQHVLWHDIRRFAAPRRHRLRRCCRCWAFRSASPSAGIRRLQPGRQSGHADPASHQPHRVDSGAIIFFGVGDHAAIFLDLSRRLLSHRGRLRQRRLQRALDLSAGPAATSACRRRSFSRASSFPRRCRRSSSGCASRSASRGWSWSRRR